MIRGVILSVLLYSAVSFLSPSVSLVAKLLGSVCIGVFIGLLESDWGKL